MPLPVIARARPDGEPPVGDGVVGRAPDQAVLDGCGRDPLLHQAVIQQLFPVDALEVRQSGAVPQHVAHRHGGLAVRGELRPILGDGRVVVEQAVVDEPMQDG